MTSGATPPEAPLRWGELTIDLRSKEAWREGTRLPLQHQPLQILAMLMERPGAIVTREELRRRLWPEGTFVDFDHSLNTAVKKLRQALADSAAQPRYIETLPGVGYRLIVAEGGVPAKRRWMRFLVPAALLVLVSGAAVVVALRGRAADPTPPGAPSLEIRRLTSLGTVVQAFISPDGEFLLYGINNESRSNELWLQQIGGPGATRLLSTREVGIYSAQFTPDGRFIYYALRDPERPPTKLYRMPALGGESTPILSGIESGKVAFSPDGDRFAYLRDGFPTASESSVLVADADGSHQRVIATMRDPESFATYFNTPSWSPDGAWIAVGSQRSPPGVERSASLIVMRPDGMERRVLSSGLWTFMGQTAWMPDMTAILAVAIHEGQPMPYRQIWRIPFPEGKPERITNDLFVHRSVSLSADGSKLVTVTAEGLASVWAAPVDGEGPAAPLTSVLGDGKGGMAAAPGGAVVFTRYEEGVFRLYRRDPDGIARRIPLRTVAGMWPAVSRDGRLAFQTPERAILTALLDGSRPRRLTMGEFPVFTPDGRFLLFQRQVGGTVSLFTIPSAGGREARLTDYPAQRASVSPAGDAIAAVCMPDEKVWRLCLIPIEGGSPFRTFPIDFEPGRFVDLEWAPDGHGILLNSSPLTGDWKNVYLQPLDGSAARRITAFTDFAINNLAVTHDGRSLLIVRERASRDAMLITGLAR